MIVVRDGDGRSNTLLVVNGVGTANYVCSGVIRPATFFLYDARKFFCHTILDDEHCRSMRCRFQLHRVVCYTVEHSTKGIRKGGSVSNLAKHAPIMGLTSQKMLAVSAAQRPHGTSRRSEWQEEISCSCSVLHRVR